ncbi:magnesium chelatase subunit I [Variovorax boronicumulans]|uniref:ATP-binding protein n=1 Tax=Variovorax boronicumulans TaxID=436515 RepID=UPI002783A08B|nr:ATP-binding protein [Variovorax boronicumulans]MDP9991562.1 magnesium chelatase subunit I [Variovorax boronicumulans]MDQ0003590.1 magnesium chelatase subunit I [Variovorax boronicumulans]
MTTAASMPVPFPFSAIAGQPHLRQALLLAAVDPGLGGVLIEGPRGTAKTTAARALAELLPGAPFVTLPLGASLESLVGTLDLGQALAGHELKFAPGLLARANGGVLYVDEINLLPDALIDSLLDAAASGVNVVERDGISHRHAARFVLVGTMNPEEGTLRPQLLDRFGLCVQLRNIEDAAERQAIVRARLAFDVDPQGFRAKHAEAEAALAAALVKARAIVADASALPYGDDVHEAVGALCIASQVDGLRADLVMLRSARALAAWEGAAAITADHVQRVAEAVLLHRRKPEAEGAASASASASAPVASNTQRAPKSSGTGQNNAGDQDWGAMPPEPVGIERVKPLRPLISSQTAQQALPKKA